MGKLGLRYPPANAVDRGAHAARVALLAEDCADIPDEWLDEAARRWARSQPFFPRTCELRDEALSFGRSQQRQCALSAPQREVHPAKRDVMDRRGEPMSAADTAELNRRMEFSGAKYRYRQDGTRFAPENSPSAA